MHAESGPVVTRGVAEDETAVRPTPATASHSVFRITDSATSTARLHRDERSTEYDDHSAQLATRRNARA